jgi:hypothetical protein
VASNREKENKNGREVKAKGNTKVNKKSSDIQTVQ